MRIIAIINQKGGVGKTTTSMNLAHALAKTGNQVMVIDLDPQANLTIGFGAQEKPQQGIAEVLMNALPINAVKKKIRDNLDLIPAGDRLGEFEYDVSSGVRRGFLLNEAISEMGAEYHFVLIDCAPTSGILGMNALLAANEIMIPVSGDYYSMQGASRMMQIIDYVETSLKRDTKKWIVLTRYHQRRKLSRSVQEKMVHYFPNKVLTTPIRETVALAESPSCGKTIFEYRRKNNGADDYMNLAKDIVDGKVCH